MKTCPHHWLDEVLWPFLRVVWEPFSQKRSHFWHWDVYPGTIPEPFLTMVDPDLHARPSRGWWSTFQNTNFLWKKVAIFRPVFPGRSYHIGFVRGRGPMKQKELCTCVMEGACGVLLGPEITGYFAVDEEGNLMPLNLVRVSQKMLLQSVPLL